MFKFHYTLFSLLYFSLAAQTSQGECTTKGKVLSNQERCQLICWQKKAASVQVPYHVAQQLKHLQNNDTIHQDLERLKNADEHTITWEQLEKKLSGGKNKKFCIFGFGSLINTRNDMNKECQPNINIPGIAFGVKRIYSMTHPQPEHSCAGLPAHGHEYEELRLDTQITGNSTDYANGILLQFTIDTPHYKHLKQREIKYNLVPIKVVDYRSLCGNPRFYNAYILCGKRSASEYSKKPHTMYNAIVIEGAQQIENQGNAGFLSLLLDTTFLPDGTTSLRTWIMQQ